MLFGEGFIDDTLHLDTDLKYSHLEWKPTYMIEAIHGTEYSTKGASDNILQEQAYRNAGMNPDSSFHYATFDNPVDFTDQLDDCYYYVGYFKLPAGNNLWWHKDYYSFFQQKHGFSKWKSGSIHRTIIHLEDWTRGQVFQCEDQLGVYWKRGECFTFPEGRGHGVGNFSTKDYVIMQVTWIKKEDVIG